ncbi:CRISPR-associated endonuclease Cas1 [Rhizobium jaguaris]|uniref:CRISPR-associated endonuclease Cas1 n=1 Tax=Rhizobium jaguaris TaxID=1312183 RepID=UPI0013C53755|nr:CRISPR-associated endonuclease Cas1 [Rhizobium jaguaris]
MPEQVEKQPPDEWQPRSDVWLKQAQKLKKFRPSRRRTEQPLILSGHGVSLRIERNTLLVKNGFTHYPQKQEIIRFFPGDLSLPSRFIFLDCSGSISFHVLSWLKEQNIDLVHLNWQGEIISSTTTAGYSAKLENVLWQRETHDSRERRLQFCIALIARKLEYSLLTLQNMNFQNEAWQAANDFLAICLNSLSHAPPASVPGLRMLEANCAAAYFRAWRGVTTAWKGKSRQFIPDHWKAFEQRNSPLVINGNRRAHHPINALLNYAYQVAESELLIQAISEGFDPTIGILHESQPNRNSFLLDLIELERAQIDYQIFHFVRSNVFSGDDFTIGNDGTVLLNPQLARYVALVVCGMPREPIEEKIHF